MARIFGILTLLTVGMACRQLEKITLTRTERIDSVAVAVPIAGHTLRTTFAWADTLIFEDERLLVQIVPNAGQHLSKDLDTLSSPRAIDGVASAKPTAPNATEPWRIVAHIKPDTAHIKVAEKTITTERQETVIVKRLPEWAKFLIGALVGLLLLVLMAVKLRGVV